MSDEGLYPYEEGSDRGSEVESYDEDGCLIVDSENYGPSYGGSGMDTSEYIYGKNYSDRSSSSLEDRSS